MDGSSVGNFEAVTIEVVALNWEDNFSISNFSLINFKHAKKEYNYIKN